MTAVRKYYSRVGLFLLLISTGVGGDDCLEGFCDGPPLSFCGEEVEWEGSAALTPQNPKLTEQGQIAILECGYNVEVHYRWATGASPSSNVRPPVSVKIGTLEGGATGKLSTAEFSTFSNTWDQRAIVGFKATKKGKPPTTVHFIISATLNKPLINLPAYKGPAISLPIIGTVIGPQPSTVNFSYHFTYYRPAEPK